MRWQHVWQKRECTIFSVHLSGRIVLGGKRRHSLKIEFWHKMSEGTKKLKDVWASKLKDRHAVFPEKTSPKRMAAAGEGGKKKKKKKPD